VFGSFNNFLGISGLVNLNRQKEFSYYTVAGGVINVTLSIILLQNLGVFGVAISVVISELLILVLIIKELLRFKVVKVG
jgi:O-antigen/teichoic acid export membrane protein